MVVNNNGEELKNRLKETDLMFSITSFIMFMVFWIPFMLFFISSFLASFICVIFMIVLSPAIILSIIFAIISIFRYYKRDIEKTTLRQIMHGLNILSLCIIGNIIIILLISVLIISIGEVL